MDKFREHAICFMEQNKILSKLNSEQWYYMEDSLTQFIRDILQDKSLEFDYHWNFAELQNMKQNEIKTFEMANYNKVIVEHDMNPDGTFGYTIQLFDKNMNNLNGWGYDTPEDLESAFNTLTHEICIY